MALGKAIIEAKAALAADLLARHPDPAKGASWAKSARNAARGAAALHGRAIETR